MRIGPWGVVQLWKNEAKWPSRSTVTPSVAAVAGWCGARTTSTRELLL